MPLLNIRNLTIEIDTPQGLVRAVDRVSLSLNEGDILGLVGESGSGKSLIAKALVGVGKENWKISADLMQLDNIDLLSLSASERRKLISRHVSMIFQEPSTCLDPSVPIGKQLIESIPSSTFDGKWYQRLFWKHKQAKALLHKVGVKDHKKLMKSYPYELTDGECQNVMVAMAIAKKPILLIADEPTNDLDSITQLQILRLLRRMNQVNNTSILLISHDLTMITNWATKITVMYCGQSVESAPTEKIIEAPKHPYTTALLKVMPDFNEKIPHKQMLQVLPGAIPPLKHLPIGCRLGPRCPYAQKKCVQVPPFKQFKNHYFSCHFPLNMERKL